MAEYKQCEFYLLRYVPDAVKDEFVNLGVVLLETGEGDRCLPTCVLRAMAAGAVPRSRG